MVYKKQNIILDEFINDFAEAKLTKAELQSFSELLENEPSIRRTARAGIKVRKYLYRLKKVRCKPGFDQRMAAKFSLELEKEVQKQNNRMLSVKETT